MSSDVFVVLQPSEINVILFINKDSMTIISHLKPIKILQKKTCTDKHFIHVTRRYQINKYFVALFLLFKNEIYIFIHFLQIIINK